MGNGELGEEASGVQTSWIYSLRKEEIITQMTAYNLPTTGTLEELRKRFAEYVRSGTMGLPKTEQTAKTVMPPQIIIHQTYTGVSTVTLLDSVRKWGLFFDGQDCKAVMFLERLQELRTAYGLSDPELLLALPELLRDKAILWYRNNHSSWATWTDAKKAFESFFFPVGYYENLDDQIRDRLQRPSEGIKDFQIDLQTLMRRQGKLSAPEQLNRLYKNLRPEYKLYIKKNDFNDVQDLISKAVTYEQLQKAMNKSRVNQSTELNDIASPGTSQRVIGKRRRRYRKPRPFQASSTDASPLSCSLFQSGDNRLTARVKIAGRNYTALVDTGAAKSYVGQRVRQHCVTSGVQPAQVSIATKLADGHEILIDEEFLISCTLSDFRTQAHFLFLPNLSNDIIIGMDLLNKWRVNIDLGALKMYIPASAAVTELNALSPVTSTSLNLEGSHPATPGRSIEGLYPPENHTVTERPRCALGLGKSTGGSGPNEAVPSALPKRRPKQQLLQDQLHALFGDDEDMHLEKSSRHVKSEIHVVRPDLFRRTVTSVQRAKKTPIPVSVPFNPEHFRPDPMPVKLSPLPSSPEPRQRRPVPDPVCRSPPVVSFPDVAMVKTVRKRKCIDKRTKIRLSDGRWARFNPGNNSYTESQPR